MIDTSAFDMHLEHEVQFPTLPEGKESVQNLLVQLSIPKFSATPSSGVVVTVGELSDAWTGKLGCAFENVDSMSEAIGFVVEARKGGASAGALIMGPGTDIQNTKSLINAIEKLNEVEIPLYVFSLNSLVDHRLLSQFAVLSGGAYALLKSPSDWDARCNQMLDAVQSGFMREGLLTIETPASMDIEAFYTLVPQPGLIQLSSPDVPRRSLSFPIMAGAEDRQQSFLLTIRTPRLQAGQYNLATIAARSTSVDNPIPALQQYANFVVANSSYKADRIRPRLAVVHQHLQLNAMLELMAQAYLREDGSGISRILDTLERELLLLGYFSAAKALAALRVNFLHRGSFALPQLNETWGIIYRTSTAFLEAQ